MMENIHKKGVSILIAVLILAAAIAVALGIFAIVFGQLQISRGARESHLAVSSAGLGIECAMYYLQRAGSVPGQSFWDPANPCFGNCTINCAGGVSEIPVEHTVDASGVHTFKFSIESVAGVCVDVIVNSRVVQPLTADVETEIISAGRSSCVPGRVVNRTIRVCDNPLEQQC